VASVTTAKSRAGAAGGEAVSIEESAAGRTRPHGKRFGTLTHAVLAQIPLDAPSAAVRAAAGVHGRLLGATDLEIDAAAVTVVAALAHPLLRRASRARPGCRREVPVMLVQDDGSLVEGIVDLAFREPEGPPEWIVVDYKTDLELAGRLVEYEEQVRLYARAVSAATGERARGVLFRI
jgi:ATP-dependent exoDNAse (exonuclease V) beta subunit